MWKIKQPNDALKQWYKEKMLKGLRNRILTKTDRQGVNLLTDNVRLILIPLKPTGEEDLTNLEHLLNDDPIALKKLNDLLMKDILSSLGSGVYNDIEFEDFLSAKATTEEGRDLAATRLYNKYADILSRLQEVFDYDQQLGKNKSRAYRLTLEQGHNTCTYCNRLYIFTVVCNEGGNDGDRITRPVLDHWYSKELFPLMSLSLCNLIPSCSVCIVQLKAMLFFVWGLIPTPMKQRLRMNHPLSSDTRLSPMVNGQ